MDRPPEIISSTFIPYEYLHQRSTEPREHRTLLPFREPDLGTPSCHSYNCYYGSGKCEEFQSTDSVTDMPILKSTPRPKTAGQQTPSRAERNRETALYHARLIQERKIVLAENFESIETLLDFPRSSTSDARHPAESDIIEVKNLLRTFQPSDYDSLVEERIIDNKCGYVLCPHPKRLQLTNAKYRILHSKSHGAPSLKVVERKELERWCSEECGKRALHIRVQLDEEPAWARPAGSGGFELLEEDFSKQRLVVEGYSSENSRNRNVDHEKERLIASLKELADERGDRGAHAGSSRLIKIAIREKEETRDVQFEPRDPVQNTSNSLGGSIEGYIPSFSYGNIGKGSMKDQDEIADLI